MKKELAQVKHARSVKEFPEIDLKEGEYVVLHMKRATVGIVMIWAGVGALILALSIALIMLANNNALGSTMFIVSSTSLHYLRLAILMAYVMIVFVGLVSHSIYNQNQMYITNFRAIQQRRISLFASSTNIIELDRIEDVSYRQNNLFDYIFKIGTLRMSTVGDETTYTFPWLTTPHDEVNIISRLVAENSQGKVIKKSK